jgi:hypothetical protein
MISHLVTDVILITSVFIIVARSTTEELLSIRISKLFVYLFGIGVLAISIGNILLGSRALIVCISLFLISVVVYREIRFRRQIKWVKVDLIEVATLSIFATTALIWLRPFSKNIFSSLASVLPTYDHAIHFQIFLNSFQNPTVFQNMGSEVGWNYPSGPHVVWSLFANSIPKEVYEQNLLGLYLLMQGITALSLIFIFSSVLRSELRRKINGSIFVFLVAFTLLLTYIAMGPLSGPAVTDANANLIVAIFAIAFLLFKEEISSKGDGRRLLSWSALAAILFAYPLVFPIGLFLLSAGSFDSIYNLRKKWLFKPKGARLLQLLAGVLLIYLCIWFAVRIFSTNQLDFVLIKGPFGTVSGFEYFTLYVGLIVAYSHAVTSKLSSVWVQRFRALIFIHAGLLFFSLLSLPYGGGGNLYYFKKVMLVVVAITLLSLATYTLRIFDPLIASALAENLFHRKFLVVAVGGLCLVAASQAFGSFPDKAKPFPIEQVSNGYGQLNFINRNEKRYDGLARSLIKAASDEKVHDLIDNTVWLPCSAPFGSRQNLWLGILGKRSPEKIGTDDDLLNRFNRAPTRSSLKKQESSRLFEKNVITCKEVGYILLTEHRMKTSTAIDGKYVLMVPEKNWEIIPGR